MKTLTRTIVAGLVLSLLGIADPVLVLPIDRGPLTGPSVMWPPETPPIILRKTTNSITVAWGDRSSNETGNILERRQPGGPWVFLADLGPMMGKGVDYTDPPDMDRDCTNPKGGCLTHSTRYCYRVHVYGAFGSKFSSETCDSTNRMRLDGVPVVDDKPGLLGELEANWDGKKLIYVDDNAVIDLTPSSLVLPAGVTLASGRDKLKKGALLLTKNRHGALFTVTGSNVRITGLRIQGPEQGIAEGDDDRDADAIDIYVGGLDGPLDSRNKIEIDHNEIYWWTHAGINVEDCRQKCKRQINAALANTVHIHDNYIHHNRHDNGAGYGVALGDGAYALIERNVFDNNRHAIAADGREGTGYKAYENLVLKGGGQHYAWGFIPGHTHQFDMHGRDSCGVWSVFSEKLFNCGLAGEYIDIRYNTFQYTEDNAFKLRGTPKLFDSPGIEAGAYVVSNVFAHLCVLPTLHCSGAALSQTESGLHQRDNLTGIDTSDELGEGDFDGDGVIDLFQATGVTWWYNSGGQTQWRYLNTSDMRLKDLFLSDVNGDGKTDVLRRSGNEWLVSCGGVGSWTKAGLACTRVESKFPGTFFDPNR